MIARAVAFSARHHRAVMVASLVAAAAGLLARRALPRDVVPDLSDPQIVLVADWMGHPAAEVADTVTSALTKALEGVPGSTAVRGSSMSGMAYVDVVFDKAARLPAGRREIVKRVETLRQQLPGTVRIDIGPEASSTGWVYQYALTDPTNGQPPLTLRHLQDTIVAPALVGIPGVVEIASVGGAVREAWVEVLAKEIAARGLAFSDVTGTLGSVLGAGPVASIDDLKETRVVVTLPPGRGQAPLVKDVARVRMVTTMPNGLADFGGTWPAVGGIVIAGRDADLAAVIERVRRALDGVRPKLPPGVQLVTVYDRLDLATRVEGTLLRALAEEVAVVVLVILLFLAHPRSALLPLATLPLCLLITFGGMWAFGMTATIMSLAGIGIALGMAVDADVVALEACHRRLERLDPGTPPAERRAEIVAAAGSVAPAILTSLLITALSFLPVLAFGGETGRLVRPLALTKTLVVAAAALVTLTLAPALRDRLLGGRITPEFANPLTRQLVRVYRPFVHFALSRPVLTLVTAGLAVLSCVPVISRLGGEFLPPVDEGDLLFMPTTVSGANGEQAALELRRLDGAMKGFTEVATIFGKIGRADTATDPAPLSMAEITVRLLPRAEWPKVARQRWYSGWAPAPLRAALGWLWPEEAPLSNVELVAALDRATRLPGWSGAWTAPVRARLDMMSTGVRTPVGIRIVAADAERLEALGAAVRAVALGLPGTRSAVFESLGGETRLELALDAAALARHAVDPALAAGTAQLLVTGGQLGELVDTGGGRPHRVRVLPEQNLRGSPDQLRDVTVRSSGEEGGGGQPVPLGLVGRVVQVARPAALRNERGELVAYVFVDLVPGTDLLGYVERAQGEVRRRMAGGALALRPGERIEWTGQYQLIAAGERRLAWIVPAVILSTLLLLFLLFRSVTEALIVFLSVPFALVGSFWTLYLLGYRLSAPVWVGLLSVVGLAMQTGVVMVVYIDAAFHRRVREGRLASRADIVAAHAEGTIRRLRPKLMTITTMGAGLLPLLWAQGAGAEIARRVAAPMIGGLATSAFLTLEVIPVIYTIWRSRQLARAQRLGVPIETVTGTIPPWAR